MQIIIISGLNIQNDWRWWVITFTTIKVSLGLRAVEIINFRGQLREFDYEYYVRELLDLYLNLSYLY